MPMEPDVLDWDEGMTSNIMKVLLGMRICRDRDNWRTGMLSEDYLTFMLLNKKSVHAEAA